MKMFNFAIFSLLSAGACFAHDFEGEKAKVSHNDESVIDRVVASVGCGSERKLVTKSEIGKPDIFKNMEPSTLDSLIEQKVIVLEAERFKIANFTINISKAEIDSRIERAKAFFGVPGASSSKFEEVLVSNGTSMETLREQVYQAGMISHLMNFMFPDKTAVSSHKIEEYYKDHPEFEEEEVHLQAAEVEPEKLEQIRIACVSSDGSVDGAELEKRVEVCDLGVVKVSQLQAKTRKIVESLKKSGQIFVPKSDSSVDNGEKATIFKLVDRKPRREKSLEERKVEISQILQGAEKDRKYKAYLEELKGQTHVRVFE